MDLRKKSWTACIGFMWLTMGPVAVPCECRTETLGRIKGGKFIDEHSDNRLLHKMAAQRRGTLKMGANGGNHFRSFLSFFALFRPHPLTF